MERDAFNADEKEKLHPAVEQYREQVEKIASSVRHAASYTTADFSIFFIVVLAIGAYFHETYFGYTLGAMAFWVVLQLVVYVSNDDFQNDLFWGMLGMLGHLAFTLTFGNDAQCLFGLLDRVKWHLVRWTLTWPFSMLYTLTKDPLVILTDVLHEWSRARYVSVIQAALSTSSANTVCSWLFHCRVCVDACEAVCRGVAGRIAPRTR